MKSQNVGNFFFLNFSIFSFFFGNYLKIFKKNKKIFKKNGNYLKIFKKIRRFSKNMFWKLFEDFQKKQEDFSLTGKSKKTVFLLRKNPFFNF